MGKASNHRDWSQIYAIYGLDQWHTMFFLLLHATFSSSLSLLFLVYFGQICNCFEAPVPYPSGARFAARFVGSATTLSAVCMFFAAAKFFYSALPLHADMAQSSVGDWSAVRSTLDLVGLSDLQTSEIFHEDLTHTLFVF